MPYVEKESNLLISNMQPVHCKNIKTWPINHTKKQSDNSFKIFYNNDYLHSICFLEN